MHQEMKMQSSDPGINYQTHTKKEIATLKLQLGHMKLGTLHTINKSMHLEGPPNVSACTLQSGRLLSSVVKPCLC